MNTWYFYFIQTTFTTSMRAMLGGVVGTLFLLNSSFAVAGECKNISTHVSSQQVTEFSDGTPCPSDICTEGRFNGVPNGKFRFIATGALPAAVVDPQIPPAFTSPPSFSTPWLVFTTGVFYLETSFCGENGNTGTLVVRDATSFAITAFPPFNSEIEGPFGDVGWVDGAASTGTCAGASGLLTGTGVFKSGCVDCDYKGRICRSSE